MTDEELANIEAALEQYKPFGLKTNYDLANAVGCGDLLLVEVRRLRELIKDVEWHADDAMGAMCPWCREYRPRHMPECPAFTENGEVR